MLHTASDWKSLCAAQMYLFLMIVPAYFLVDNADVPRFLFAAGAHFILGAIALSWFSERDYTRHADRLYSRFGTLRVNPFQEVAAVKVGIVTLALGIVLFYVLQLLWLLVIFYLLSGFFFYAASLRLTALEREDREKQGAQPAATPPTPDT